MYIKEWNAFSSAVEELYKENPSKARLTMKYRDVDGKMIVKVTDDVVCLKYKTDQAQDVKKIEKLSLSYMLL
eukprot:CFRG2828T1